ncbi:MAG TPA: helicase [Thermodesulforhabdus norvegica]|uniref:Helicase n=1 Tax=Thermodesulforhabdus norvegica TaxID=39841 RepID=A0A7C0WV08_9BACT|nr:helicase [Thermodesulforhabdus norvegica]
MNIKNIVHDLVFREKRESRFRMIPDSDGLNFVLPPDDFEKCRNGEADGWSLHQYVCLRMLEEQGYAKQIPNGYLIPSDNAVVMEDDAKFLLDFPPPFPGHFRIRVNSETSHSTFSIHIIPVMPDGKELPNYGQNGPCLQFGSQELYILSSAEWLAFSSLKAHQSLPSENKSELHNLKLVGSLQAARKLGMDIDLSHFNQIEVREPGKVGVAVTQQEDGCLLLTPTFGPDMPPKSIAKRLGQLSNAIDIGVIRIQDQIVVLDEKRLKATHEIISNRLIPRPQVKRFLKSPSAFLDASLVDLDAGFSLRVRGATVFRHAYFGETDESGLSWFDREQQKTEQVCQPSVLHNTVKYKEDLQLAKKRIDDARNTGASVIEFGGKTIDISDSNAVDSIIRSIEKKITGLARTKKEPAEQSQDKEGKDRLPIIVDIAKNDDQLELGSDDIPALIKNATYKPHIDYSIYKRQPFPHQDEGIRWILGLAQPTLSLPDGEESLHGALLADDMGLGKTYMALVAISEYFRLCKEKNIVERPVLIVVPLTLLENWREEIQQTFHKAPFSDVVLLQADAHLRKFRIGGAGIEIKQQAAKEFLNNDNQLTMPENAIRYSLKIGKEFGADRLDLPRRVVFTTYQTLRDYQFSLCRIDWSFVVFDEAQHIKNPNTLATRAAKGLKARFKLLATGTPVENHLGDFWCLMDTARPGALGAYQDFRQEYIMPIRHALPDQAPELRQTIGKNLRSKVGALMLRRLKEDNLPGLPKKYIYSGLNIDKENGCQYDPLLEKEMNGEQLQRYDTTIDTVVEVQQKGDGTNPILAGLYQLREISLHPLLLNRGVLTTPKNSMEARELIRLSGKLEILLDILDQIRKKGEKAIIFLINKRLQSFLKVALGRIYDINVEIINGDTKAISTPSRTANNTRKEIINNFECQKGFGVILMSPIAAGTGLTVVAANNVIHLERHWNPAKEDQASDRVFRIGQTKDVNVYLPIIKHPSIDSFDVNLHRLLSNKVTLKDAVITPEEVTNEEMGAATFRATVNQEDQDRPLRGKDLRLLSWQEFEALCAEIYGQHLRGEAFLTPTNDYGADVVIFGKKQNALVQCKHISMQKYDSIDPLTQIHSAKPVYEEKTGKKFSKLIVAVTARKYSKKVVGVAPTYKTELVAQGDLDNLMKVYKVSRKEIQRRLLASRIFEA